ncbi:endo alpha-1,4 polygalactosaminidase [Salegentibacter sp. Hel_I_6]|uniref:endo alpha-1,4 polygalactosaminidase n=1 Tax=Salegentibacter sp. Hel_I_6 TaxID=1250278 RepID=UPI000563134E|nr:endo alpha-1,4 polygalactosaminidase [Salegentibacter sp. Hel_I_6]
MKFLNISSVLIYCFLVSCQNYTAQESNLNIDYREEMRNFVMEISSRAKEKNPDFSVIPQNGVELLLKDNNKVEIPALKYLDAIDAVAQEDLFFGYPKINKPTPKSANLYLKKYLNVAKKNNKEVLVIDYCSSSKLIEKSYALNKENDFVSFAATSRELDKLPGYKIRNENKLDITALSQAKNFLYLLNYSAFPTKEELIAELAFTNYDLLILDLYFQDGSFTPEDLKKLKKKENGGERLVVSYMSIGEAEDYRYYWQENWSLKNQEWLVEENPNWKGNFKVKYWNKDWKNVIYGNENAYLTKIIDAGFDGVYLDIIDGYQYFEAQK